MTAHPARLLVSALAVAILGAPTFAAEVPKGYVCYRAKTPVVVDGKLNEAAWADAPWTDEFVDIEGDLKPRPRFRTRAKMLWDDRYFYVAAALDEPNVWGTLTKHDSVIFHDNDFEIFLDPDGDHHEYYELEINALNTEWDLFLKKPYRDGGPAVDAWEIPGLSTATNVQGTLNDPTDKDSGWSVEFAIPWAVLGEYAHRPSPPKNADQWRVNFSRVEWEVTVDGKTVKKVPDRREDNWVWSPQGVVDMHRPERWGFVQFSTAEPGRDSFRPDPEWPVRERLVAIYQAERQAREKSKAWNLKLDTLGVSTDPPLSGVTAPVLRPAGDGYEAVITVGGASPRVFSIREDSRLTVRPAPAKD